MAFISSPVPRSQRSSHEVDQDRQGEEVNRLTFHFIHSWSTWSEPTKSGTYIDAILQSRRCSVCGKVGLRLKLAWA